MFGMITEVRSRETWKLEQAVLSLEKSFAQFLVMSELGRLHVWTSTSMTLCSMRGSAFPCVDERRHNIENCLWCMGQHQTMRLTAL